MAGAGRPRPGCGGPCGGSWRARGAPAPYSSFSEETEAALSMTPSSREEHTRGRRRLVLVLVLVLRRLVEEEEEAGGGACVTKAVAVLVVEEEEGASRPWRSGRAAAGTC